MSSTRYYGRSVIKTPKIFIVYSPLNPLHYDTGGRHSTGDSFSKYSATFAKHRAKGRSQRYYLGHSRDACASSNACREPRRFNEIAKNAERTEVHMSPL